MASIFRAIWKSYNKMLARHPVTSKAITAGEYFVRSSKNMQINLNNSVKPDYALQCVFIRQKIHYLCPNIRHEFL